MGCGLLRVQLRPGGPLQASAALCTTTALGECRRCVRCCVAHVALALQSSGPPVCSQAALPRAPCEPPSVRLLAPLPLHCCRNLFDYDQVVNTQRDKIYSERRKALLASDLGQLMVGRRAA